MYDALLLPFDKHNVTSSAVLVTIDILLGCDGKSKHLPESRSTYQKVEAFTRKSQILSSNAKESLDEDEAADFPYLVQKHNRKA